MLSYSSRHNIFIIYAFQKPASLFFTSTRNIMTIPSSISNTPTWLLLSDKWEDTLSQTAYLRFLLCRQGEMKLRVQGASLFVAADILLIVPPNCPIEIEEAQSSPGLQCFCMGVSTSYQQRILPMLDNYWDIKLLVERHPLFNPTREETDDFCEYYQLLERKQAALYSPFRANEINALVSAFFYNVANIVKRQIKHTPRSFASKEYLFKDFIELITSLHPKPRRVEYYAGKLCITPKYLSSACKDCGGMTATGFIDLYVLKDIKYLLTHTSMSIKEICNELDFPNLSFFGRYVKRHFGMSPKAYRDQALKEYGTPP